MVERKEETVMKKEYLDKIAEYGQLIVVSGPSGVGNKTGLREICRIMNRRVSVYL